MNVQQTIIRGIRELLYTHNYLVLPGFGGFILKSMPAHFGSPGTHLLPASKTVSFNGQLRQNDGILTLWLQEKLPCSAPEALQHLQDFAGFCSGILTARRRLTLERIGFFYLDFENNTCFEPQPDTNFLPESFGLGPVSVREIEVPVAEPRREPAFTDRVILSTPEAAPQTRRNYRRVVVPALFSLAFFSLLLLFVANTRFSGQLRASAFGSGAAGVYQPIAYPDLSLVTPQQNIQAYVADANGIASLELGHDLQLAVSVETSLHAVAKRHATSQKHMRRGNFEIVLGCFTVQENANRMATKLERQHIDVQVSGKNEKGMYVVSDGSFTTREDALERLKELKQDFPNAWISRN